MIDPNEIPEAEPEQIQAGATVKWKRSLGDFPASAGWVLSYVFINADGKITITTTADGDDHLVNAAATVTAAWSAGRYDWQATAAKDDDRYLIDSGAATVLADFAQAATKDDRSHARKTLAAINAMLEGKATKDQSNYAIEGRSLSRYSWGELIEAKRFYMGLVAMENRKTRNKNGKGHRGKLGVQF